MQHSASDGAARRTGRGLVRFGLTALLGVLLLAYVLPTGWLTALLQHFPAYYAWAAMGLAVLARWSRSATVLQGGCAFLAVGLFAFWATPRLPAAAQTLHDPASMRVVWANLQHDPRKVESFLDWLETLDPPPLAIGLAEVHDEASVIALRERYPHGLADRATGVALLTREEPQAMQSVWVQNGRPILHLEMSVEGRRVDLVAAHALVPVGAGAQPALTPLVELLDGLDTAVVLADLNQTPWSTAYRQLIRGARLQDARRGQWPRKTWRPRRSWLVGLPIDHVLYRGAVQVEQFRLGPDVGSDHLPLLADLALGSGEASDH